MKIQIIACYLCIIIGTSLTGAAQEVVSSDYSAAYSNDNLWPATVTPILDIQSSSGDVLLSASIPVVLSRAYEDGKLAVIDRVGCVLVDYEQTNFVDAVNKLSVSASSEEKEHDTHILLNQLARRIYDQSFSESKAVSEEELKKYSAFLSIRTSSVKEALQITLDQLQSLENYLEAENICVVLIFDELMQNKQFYELVSDMKLAYPVVVPIFQKGLIQALFTDREQDCRVLLLKNSGKLIHSGSTLESFIKEICHPTKLN